MLKTKLLWRVLANFAFLLIILTAMTLLTLYLLAEIEKNFGSTSNEIRTLTNVENVRHVLADAPDAANFYLITGDESAKASYKMPSRNLTMQYPSSTTTRATAFSPPRSRR